MNELEIAAQPIDTTVECLSQRNQRAQEVIKDYAKMHAGMDIIIGLLSLIPGMAIPALAGAVAAQGKAIYQPMAADLAAIYTVDAESLGQNVNELRQIVAAEWIHTSVLDVAAEFGHEFLMQIAAELLSEIGMGVLASACVPILGAPVGAALDYLIANIMTWRVGTMVSMFYQNNGEWLGSQHATFEATKSLTGGISQSVQEVLAGKSRHFKVDLDSLPSRFPEISKKLTRALKLPIEAMRHSMNNDQIREALQAQGIPLSLVDRALAIYGNRAENGRNN